MCEPRFTKTSQSRRIGAVRIYVSCRAIRQIHIYRGYGFDPSTPKRPGRGIYHTEFDSRLLFNSGNLSNLSVETASNLMFIPMNFGKSAGLRGLPIALILTVVYILLITHVGTSAQTGAARLGVFAIDTVPSGFNLSSSQIRPGETKVKGRIEIDRERCKGCGLCILVCPKKRIEISEELNTKGYYPATLWTRVWKIHRN